MLALTLQTMLLLGVAYVLGCCLGCLLKRTLVAPRQRLTAPAIGSSAVTASAAPLAERATVTPPLAPLTVARGPLANLPTTPQPDAFRRADMLEPTQPSARATPAASAPTQPPAAQPRPSTAAPAARFEAALSGSGTPQSAAAQPTAEKRSPSNLGSGGGGTLAAAAAAAAAVAASQSRTPANPNPPPAPSATRPSTPPAATPPTRAATTGPDDLKRIRGIDAQIEAALVSLGFRRFSEIAAWKPEDVARVNAMLGFKGRIEQENWIEQAQILARGEETFYSRRLVDKEPTPKPAPAVMATQATPVRPAAPVAPPSSTTPAQAPAAKPITPTIATPAQTATPAAPAAPRSDATQSAAAAAAAVAAAVAGRPSPGPAGLPPRTAPTPSPPSPIAQPAPSSTPISGGEPARATPPAEARPAPIVSMAPEPEMDEAAALIARTFGTPAAKPPASPPDSPSAGEPPAAAAPTATATPPASAPPQPTSEPSSRPSDFSNLRSVRSEAFRPGETSVGAAGQRTARNSAPDDLKRIRGIGVLIERKLNGMGVTSYEQIANWSATDIDRVSDVLDFKGRIERENWVEQARILAAGGQTEFSRRSDPSG